MMITSNRQAGSFCKSQNFKVPALPYKILCSFSGMLIVHDRLIDWATVYKTVRPMLSTSVCPVCLCVLSVLSVTLVYCGQTVGLIKMKFGIQVGFSHTVFDRDRAPAPSKGHSPQFSAYVRCGQMAVWIQMPLGMEVGLGSRDFVLDWDPAPPHQGGAEPPNLGPCLLWPNGWMDQDGPLHGGGPRSRPHCARLGRSSPLQKGAQPPNFRPMSIVVKRRYVCIRIPFRTKIRLNLAAIELDGDPAPLALKGHSPNLRPMSIVAKQLDGSRCHLIQR